MAETALLIICEQTIAKLSELVCNTGHAAEGHWKLGSLAAWWMNKAALGKSGISRSCFCGHQGECLLLFANKHAKRDLLAEAFALPVIWRERDGDDDDRRLPRTVREIASVVRSLVSIEFDAAKFHLFLGEEIRDVDLCEIDWPAESAFASLAAGLLDAIHGAPEAARQRVAASAAFDVTTYTASKVEQLSEKLRVAAELGVERFFVSIDQPKQADFAHMVEQLGDKPLPLAQWLAPMLGAMLVPPKQVTNQVEFRQGASINRRFSLLRLTTKANKAWLDHIAAYVGRERRIKDDLLTLDADIFVALYSQSWVQVATAIACFQPRSVLLLATDTDPQNRKSLSDAEEAATRLRHWVDDSKLERKCEVLPPQWVDYHRNQLAQIDALRGVLDQFVCPGTTVIDITPGYKAMSIAMCRLASGRCNTKLVICHQANEKNVVAPESICYEIVH